MKVGLAYHAFAGSFAHYFPQLEVIGNDYRRTKDFDLIIFTGGEDINPAIYDADNMFSAGVNEHRDEIERRVFVEATSKGKKILGVCRGHQLINALMGGYLVQDIYLQRHRYGTESHRSPHGLDGLSSGSLVLSTFKLVNSMHHQGVVRAGSGLKPTSAHNGVIESCESPNVISVQFHPEFMCDDQADLFFKRIETWVTDPDKLRAEIASEKKSASGSTSFSFAEYEAARNRRMAENLRFVRRQEQPMVLPDFIIDDADRQNDDDFDAGDDEPDADERI